MKSIAVLNVLCSVWLIVSAAAGEGENKTISRHPEDNEIDIGDVKELTYDDLPSELRTWTPPAWLSKNFPVYCSGFDFEDRPIWVAEIGKYDFRKIMSRGENGTEETQKYARYVARIMTDSHTWKNPEGKHISMLLDFDGLQMGQYATLPAIRFLLHLGREFLPLLESHIEQAVVINANFVTETLISIMRPVFSRLIGMAEIYGTDRSIWLPQLLRRFPKESLPSFYGGEPNFTPVKVIG